MSGDDTYTYNRYGDGFSWRRINYNLDLHESGKNPSKCKIKNLVVHVCAYSIL